MGCWVAASANDVDAVLQSGLCAVRPLAEPVPEALAGTVAGEIFCRLVRMQDGEAHTRLKRVIFAALQDVPDEEMVREAVAAARQLLPADLNAFAFALPIYAVGRILGFPSQDLPRLTELLQAFAPCLTPGSSPQTIQDALPVATELWGFVGVRPLNLLNELEADSATTNRIGLLWQAYESTAGLILHGLLRVAAKGEPDDWDAFMLSLVREATPIQNTRRFIVQSGELLGEQVKPGQVILVVLAAANHGMSSAGFSFGAGSHACPGQRLALTIAREGIKAVLDGGYSIPARVGFKPSVNARLPMLRGETA